MWFIWVYVCFTSGSLRPAGARSGCRAERQTPREAVTESRGNANEINSKNNKSNNNDNNNNDVLVRQRFRPVIDLLQNPADRDAFVVNL